MNNPRLTDLYHILRSVNKKSEEESVENDIRRIWNNNLKEVLLTRVSRISECPYVIAAVLAHSGDVASNLLLDDEVDQFDHLVKKACLALQKDTLSKKLQAELNRQSQTPF